MRSKMKNINREYFWIIVVTLVYAGIYNCGWSFNGFFSQVLDTITSNALISEIAIMTLVIGVLAWLQYKYGLVMKAIGVYLTVKILPYALLWLVFWWIGWLFKEKDGAEIYGGGYIYKSMNWPEYIRYKFTGRGRVSA